jgi:hypothetical protein
MLPTDMLQRIRLAYSAVRTLDDAAERSPVKKNLVVVTGHEAVVHMEDVEVEENPQDNNTPNLPNNSAIVTPTRHDAVNGQPNRNLLLSVMGSVNSLRRVVTEYGSSIESMRGSINRQERTVRSLVRRIDANPLQQLQRAAQGRTTTTAPASPRRQVDSNRDPRAVLSENPRTLHQLWDEYEHGIGANKPAKHFTRAERGPCKFKCSRRKIFWDVVDCMVNRGVSSHDATEQICAHYGPGPSVTAIINKLRVDKRNLPPTLR